MNISTLQSDFSPALLVMALQRWRKRQFSKYSPWGVVPQAERRLCSSLLYPPVLGAAEGKLLIDVRRCLGHGELSLCSVLSWAAFGPLDPRPECEKVCAGNVRCAGDSQP